MSRSKRKPIVKDKPRNYKRTSWYWRHIRRVVKGAVRQGKEELPQPKTLISDYDYSDYRFDYRFIRWENKYTKRAARK